MYILLQAKYFTDFKPGGALCRMLTTAYEFMNGQGWSALYMQDMEVCLFIMEYE